MRNHNTMDAVNMLVNLRERVGDRWQRRIDEALEKAVLGVIKTQNEDGGLGQDDTMESDQDATAYGVWALVMTGYLDGLFYKETCGLIPVERYRT